MEASTDGVLGGFGHMSDADVRDSEAFLNGLLSELLPNAANSQRHLVALGTENCLSLCFSELALFCCILSDKTVQELELSCLSHNFLKETWLCRKQVEFRCHMLILHQLCFNAWLSKLNFDNGCSKFRLPIVEYNYLMCGFVSIANCNQYLCFHRLWFWHWEGDKKSSHKILQ